MKNIKNKILLGLIGFSLIGITSCNDFLDKEPESQLTPENYFNTADQLSAYSVSMYDNVFQTHRDYSMGNFALNVNTDNQARRGESNEIWIKGWKQVPNKKVYWRFDNIRDANFFLQKVMPKYKNNEIQGNISDVKEAIGEIYFIRAYEYFKKMQIFGDFPIIKDALPDDRKLLIQKEKRFPQNQVARFILEDLDKAAEFLKEGPVANKNRLSKEAAWLLKSRVALYEGTWLKYHKGTAFVPGGAGWPGKKEDINFPNGYDEEINYFLREAMSSAEKVIEKVPLTPSNHKTQGLEPYSNPYYMMFADKDMAKYSEVILWRDYDAQYGVAHATQVYLRLANQSGYTNGFVNCFLTQQGIPVYASKDPKIRNSDNSLNTITIDKDERLQLFMKKPGDIYTANGKFKWYTPRIGGSGYKSATGYEIRKGLGEDELPQTNSANKSENGCLIFRGTEAYLNYIEAQYVLDGNVSAKSEKYWGDLRERAGIVRDYRVTVDATDMNYESDLKRSDYDWAAYSAGVPVDATLYSIRRERRSEFIAEGFRMNDLRRWRALDQVRNYQVEGLKIWGPMKSWFEKQGVRYLPAQGANVSSPELSDYFRPYQVRKENRFYDGYTWQKAHYLEPIAAKELELAAPDGNPANSVIYQNPGWPTNAGGLAFDVE